MATKTHRAEVDRPFDRIRTPTSDLLDTRMCRSWSKSRMAPLLSYQEVDPQDLMAEPKMIRMITVTSTGPLEVEVSRQLTTTRSARSRVAMTETNRPVIETSMVEKIHILRLGSLILHVPRGGSITTTPTSILETEMSNLEDDLDTETSILYNSLDPTMPIECLPKIPSYFGSKIDDQYRRSKTQGSDPSLTPDQLDEKLVLSCQAQ